MRKWWPRGKVVWRAHETVTVLDQKMQVQHLLKRSDISTDLLLVTVFKRGPFNKVWVMSWIGPTADEEVLEETMQENIAGLIDKALGEGK